MTALTDRELLELAAKAAGIEAHDWLPGLGFAVDVPWKHGLSNVERWNPLTDDGDALRLAVTLAIAIYPPEEQGRSATANPPGHDAPWINEPAGSDHFAASRRAIVRAAAAIGQAQEASGVDAGAAGAQPSDAAK
jgi:hypothetical protein